MRYRLAKSGYQVDEGNGWQAGAEGGWHNPHRPPPLFRPLMNGTNMEGWESVRGAGTWFVRNGNLVGRGGNKPGEVAFVTSSRRDFGDFRLRLEVVLPDGKFGMVMLRINPADKGASFYGIAIGGSEPRDTTVTPGSITRVNSVLPRNPVTSWKALAKSHTVTAGKPFMLDIQVRGGKITTMINGLLAAEFQDSSPLHPGGIGFTIRPNSELRFHAIEVQELPPLPKA